ncbi:MAG: hypothetical protein KGI71_03215 [Patescibacteria group bacterium]|nr:hypothetical protein [Patescibacteria group bacterium]
MTIADTRDICKAFLARIPKDMLLVAILVLTSLFSFGLGYLAGLDAAGKGSPALTAGQLLPVASTSSQVVASRNGTKYYLPGCAGADRIAETNKIWFASAVDARAAGYAPAANCNGL